MPLTLYGLLNCDTCRKARRALEASGQEVEVRDVRRDPLPPEQLARFLDTFGDALLNTRSTTWRGLSEAERTLAPADLLAAYPVLMKRPVIAGGDTLTLGWTGEVRARWGV